MADNVGYTLKVATKPASYPDITGDITAIQPFSVYGFAPDTRSQRYRRIDLGKYIKREEEAPAEVAPLKRVIKRANFRSELRYPLYFPVVYRPAEPVRKTEPALDPAIWTELLVAADRAHRRYMQLQEEEDVAFVASILAAM